MQSVAVGHEEKNENPGTEAKLIERKLDKSPCGGARLAVCLKKGGKTRQARRLGRFKLKLEFTAIAKLEYCAGVALRGCGMELMWELGVMGNYG